MNRYSSAICSRYSLTVSTTFICRNRLKSKMAAFLAFFKIHCFRTIPFSKAPPSKTAPSRNSMRRLIDLLMKEANISDLYSSFLDKNGVTMTVGRGPQVSDRFFKKNSVVGRGRGRLDAPPFNSDSKLLN